MLNCVVVVCLVCFACVEVCCVFVLSIHVYGVGCCFVLGGSSLMFGSCECVVVLLCS